MNVFISFLQLLVNICSLVVQTLIAKKIGPSEELDLYYAIFAYTIGFIGLASVAATFLVPAQSSNSKSNNKNLSDNAGISIVSMLICSGLLIAFGVGLLEYGDILTRYKSAILGNESLMPYMVTGAIASSVTTTLGAIASVHGKIILYIISAIFSPLFMSGYLLFSNNPTVANLAFAQTFGLILQCVLLGYLSRELFSFVNINIKSIWNFLKSAPIAVGSTICFSGYSFIDVLIAPNIETGLLSIQSFSQRMVIACMVIISAGPFLRMPHIYNKLSTSRDYCQLVALLKSTFIRLILISFFISILCYNFGPLAFRWLFSSEKFSNNDIDLLVIISSILLLGAGAMQYTAVAFRVLFSHGRILDSLFLSMLWLTIYLLASLVTKNMFGELTLAISYSFTWYIIAILTMFKISKELKKLSAS